MKNQSAYWCVGRVHSAQGLRGELFIDLFARQAAWEDRWTSLALSGKIQNSHTFSPFDKAEVEQFLKSSINAPIKKRADGVLF